MMTETITAREDGRGDVEEVMSENMESPDPAPKQEDEETA